MKRYTDKVGETAYVLNKNAEEEPFEMRDKFGQLEDIEQERGIDIRILDQVLKNGAYFKNPYHNGEKIRYFNGNDLYSYLDLKNNRFDIRMFLFVGPHDYSTGGALFPFKEYGKLFALTREELE